MDRRERHRRFAIPWDKYAEVRVRLPEEEPDDEDPWIFTVKGSGESGVLELTWEEWLEAIKGDAVGDAIVPLERIPHAPDDRVCQEPGCSEPAAWVIRVHNTGSWPFELWLHACKETTHVNRMLIRYAKQRLAELE